MLNALVKRHFFILSHYLSRTELISIMEVNHISIFHRQSETDKISLAWSLNTATATNTFSWIDVGFLMSPISICGVIFIDGEMILGNILHFEDLTIVTDRYYNDLAWVDISRYFSVGQRNYSQLNGTLSTYRGKLLFHEYFVSNRVIYLNLANFWTVDLTLCIKCVSNKSGYHFYWYTLYNGVVSFNKGISINCPLLIILELS